MNIIPERCIFGNKHGSYYNKQDQILNIIKKPHNREDIIPHLSDDSDDDNVINKLCVNSSSDIETNSTININKKDHSPQDIIPQLSDSDDDKSIDNNNDNCNQVPSLETYFSTIRNQNSNNIDYPKLKHIKFDTNFFINKNVSNDSQHGAYSEDSILYKQLENWLNKGISKEINVCTVTKRDLSPIIKTGKRYNIKLNRQKINTILNYNKKNKIYFNPHQFTYGIKFSGVSMGSRHNACISAIYTDSNFFDPKWYINPNNLATSKLRVKQFYFHDCSSQNLSSILQLLSQQNDLNSTYLFGYYLDHNLDLLSVSSFKYANIYFQIRLRGENTNGYLLEFRLILDRFLFRSMRNYIKLTLFIITLEVYKSFANYSFSLQCWQGYYESFRRHIDCKHKFEYKYIHSDGESQTSLSNASGDKYELYILIDPFEIESRVDKYLKSNNINLDDHKLYPRENISHQDSGEEDIFIQYPIDVVIWIINLVQNNEETNHEELIKIISTHKIKAYFKMIKDKSSGLSKWNPEDNRIKHFNGYIYKYGTSNEQNNKKDDKRGMRKQRYSKTPLFYTVEHGNLHRLGVKDTKFDMNACNLYHGIKKSCIGQHKEDYKFKGKIWSKITGESSFLTIGGIQRGWTNFIVTIFTQNGCYIGYNSQGFCMTIAGHGLKPPHLIWEKFVYRLCDLYRFVKDEIVKKCNDHLLDCECWEDSQFQNICNCIKGKAVTQHSKLPTMNELLPQIV